MKTLLCSICLLISFNTFAQKKDTVNASAPKVIFQECLDKPLKPDFYKGKFLVLDFWATWCAPCIAGFPHFNEFADKYGNADVLFASITDEPANTARKFFTRTKKQLHALKLTDTTRATGDSFAIHNYPSCVIIGPDNTIRWKGETSLLTADILDRVLLRNENLYSPKPIIVTVVDIKKPEKKVAKRPLFAFSVTEADTSDKNYEQGGYGSDRMGIVNYSKPNVHLNTFFQDLTGFSPSTRILTNDTLRMKKTYSIDFQTRTDTTYYKNYTNTILPLASRKNFILATLGDALKFDVSLVKRQTKHYELIITDTAKLHAFMSMQKGHSSFDDDHLPKFEIVGFELKDISQYLENDTKTIITTPGINDTNIYDFSFDLTNMDSFKNGLKMYGLALKEVNDDVTFLNIKFY